MLVDKATPESKIVREWMMDSGRQGNTERKMVMTYSSIYYAICIGVIIVVTASYMYEKHS